MKKKILICGGSKGWGAYLAKNFRKDYSVIVNSRKNLKVKGHIKKDMALFTMKDFIKINPDIVCNNGFDKKDYFKSFKAQINILKKSLEFFKKKQNGIIININSYYGFHPDIKDPDYASAKYGLRGYVESVSGEAFKNNIRIINVYPRAIATGLNEGREDIKNLMDPDETAKLIVDLCKTKSFYCSTIIMDRTS